MKHLKILFLLAGIGCFSIAKAQTRSADFFAFSWEIAAPSNVNYLTKTSFAGGRLEYRRKITPNFSVGLAWSWNSFDQYYGTQTYKSSDGSRAVTTDMVRQIYTSPVTATAFYYPTMQSRMIKPYIGIGLGAEFAEQNAYFNIYKLSSNNWGFVARPEIGAIIRFPNRFRGLLSFSYNMATNANDDFNIHHLDQFGVDIGMGWGF